MKKFFVPITFEQARKDQSWLTDPIWPLPLKDTQTILHEMVHRLDDISRNLDARPGAALALISGFLVARLGALADWSMLNLAAKDAQLELPRPPNSRQIIPDTVYAEPRWAWARSMLRSLDLSGVTNRPRRLNSKERCLIVSHNDLLRDFAKKTSTGAKFCHASQILNRARSRQEKIDHDMVESALRPILDFLGHLAPVLVQEKEVLRQAIERAVFDLDSLAHMEMPDAIWIGTAGYYPSRALALSRKLAGGHVTGFDHGGPTGMLKWCAALHANEFRAVDRFVTATPSSAMAVLSTCKPKDVRVFGHDGFPSFKNFHRKTRSKTRKNKAEKMKVLYVMSPFYGFRQWYPPLLSDPVYLAFSRQVGAALSDLPIHAVAKPRPGGPSPHPIAEHIQLSDRIFEDIAPNFDVLVFDDVHSSTFWKSLGSSFGIVLLDLGLNQFSRYVADNIACRIVRIEIAFNDRNIPILNQSALGDGIFESLRCRESKHFFCDLFLGEGFGRDV